MNMTAHDQLVTAYLERLRTATADLPPAERDELVANIGEHIATSLAELPEPDEAAVRAVLDRVGDPAAIAAEARGQSSQPSQSSQGGQPSRSSEPRVPIGTDQARPGALEWGGVAVLGLGSYVLPVIGTVAGLIMISLSRWWTTRQKIVAALLSIGSAVVIIMIGAAFFLTVQTVSPSGNNGEPVQAPQPTQSN